MTKESIPHGSSLVGGFSMKAPTLVVVWLWCLFGASFVKRLEGLEGSLRDVRLLFLARGLLPTGVGLSSNVWFFAWRAGWREGASSCQ